MLLEVCAATDTGPVRENNEDRWRVDLDRGLFVIADGMGGHAAGEVAAQIAVDTIFDVLLGAEDPDETRLVLNLDDNADSSRERMRYGMNQAVQRLRSAVLSHPTWTGMGTTLVVLQITEDQAHLAHVGDSRAYLLREGTLLRLTRDHTVVQQEVDAGRLTPELARTVPHRNILTRSIGVTGTLVEPDTLTRQVAPDDVFLLCTDGLTDPLEDGAIAELLLNTHPEDVAQVLVEQALAKGGEDNVTCVVVRVMA